jgi:CubicO group peptidase (beta-lactamase class C family)
MKKFVFIGICVMLSQTAKAQQQLLIEPFIGTIDALFKQYAEEKKLPGVAYGIVYQGKLIHSKGIGLSQLPGKIPASPQSVFRIASMSKSFTSMAILKLRDQGKLHLDEPASKYVPELKGQKLVSQDGPEITIRHLMTHGAGFPEDNPWGDRQLGISDAAFSAMLKKGIQFSNNPGTTYEYSNMGFALLGRIIQNVSKKSYQNYIQEEIWKPLGMKNTFWEYEKVPKGSLALGYRYINNEWVEQPMEHDGAYGAMGGMLTTIEDFSKYVAFHLSAWPERNEAEKGPIKRSSVREMQFPWNISGINPANQYPNGKKGMSVTAYGYGLSWTKDYAQRTSIAHSGGLPGFGSQWRIFPEYELGIISFSNLTYAPMGAINMKVLDSLLASTNIKPRAIPVSAILKQRQKELVGILHTWNQAEKSGIFAENFFMDYFPAMLQKESDAIFKEVGEIQKVHEILPENQLRGSFRLECERGDVEVSFTLTPENPPLIQEFHIRTIKKAQD